MTSRTALFTATLLAASAPTAVLARPTIIVDEAIPFSAEDLENAVSIRADSDADIHVISEGNFVVITVGNQTRSLEVDPAADPHDLTRVVALIIVALDAPTPVPSAPATPPSTIAVAGVPGWPAPPAPPAPPGPPAMAPLAPTPAPEAPPIAAPGIGSTVLFGATNQLPPPKNWTVRFQAGVATTELYNSYPLMATLSRRIGPSAHIVVGIGSDQAGLWNGMSYEQSEVDAIPMRAGVELRHRWFAIEGGLAATRWEDPCNGAVYATGGYASARAYLFPLGAIQNRFFAEAGVRHVTAVGCTNESSDSLENRLTTVSASLGLELPL